MRKLTTAPCDRCGAETTKRNRSGRAFLCRPCAADLVADTANQMAEKSGPIYDRWVEAMAGAAARAVGGKG